MPTEYRDKLNDKTVGEMMAQQMPMANWGSSSLKIKITGLNKMYLLNDETISEITAQQRSNCELG
jgi:hypothetical protein